MKFLDNLKISVKILSVLGLLGAVTAYLIVSGGMQMTAIESQYSEITNGIARARAEFARASRRIAGMGYLAHEAVAQSGKPDQIKAMAAKIDENLDAALKNFKQAKELNPANGITYDAYHQDTANLHAVIQHVVGLSLKGEPIEARAAMSKVTGQLEEIGERMYAVNGDLQNQMLSASKQVEQEATRDIFLNYAVGFSALVVCFLLGAWLSLYKISRPLSRMTERMSVLAGGDLSVEVDGQQRKDEVGAMAKAVQVFKDNALALKAAEEAAEAQRRQAEEERARNDAQREETARQVAQVVAGLGSGLERLAHGDLTYRVTDRWAAEYGKIQEDFNAAIDKLQDTIANIIASSSEVSNAAAEISSSTTDLSQRTEEQAASLEETSASMEEIAATVKKNAENAREANDLAQNARSAADQGGKVVADVVSAMSRIEDSSRKISDIISVIDELARQTNLLALNAAVEAARAGDAGRGFAVVASEVRGLAQRSSQAAKDIADLIVNSSSQVQEGVGLVNKAGESLAAILHSVNSVATIVSDIANASSEQAAGIDQINVALSQMDEVTQQNSALVEENAATAKTLEEQQAAMSQRVGYFRVGSSDVAEPIAEQAPRAVQPVVRTSKANGSAKGRYRPVTRGNLAVKANPENDFAEF